MAECDWAILCDYAFLDASGKSCMIGVFDRIFSATVPSGLTSAAIAIRLLGSPNEQVEMRVEIVRPSGVQMSTFGGPITIGLAGFTEIQIKLQGLPLPDIGVYSINVYAGQALLKAISFTVAYPPKQQAAAT